jgi:nucleotide-binding universal stress UspA family protein
LEASRVRRENDFFASPPPLSSISRRILQPPKIQKKKNMELTSMKKNTNETKGFSRIIVLVDESDYYRKAAQKALFLAKESGKKVVALYVIDTPRLTDVIPADSLSVEWKDLLTKQGQKVLDEIEKKGSTMGVTVEKKLMEDVPEEIIMKEAEKNDLIVMGCKGKSAVDRISMGSVCEIVTRHASSPVMVIR